MPPQPPPEQQHSWAAEKLIALTQLAKAEAQLFAKIWNVLKEWGSKLHGAVFGHAKAAPGAGIGPDPLGVFTVNDWLADQFSTVLVDIEEIWTDGYAETPDAPE